MYLSLCVSDYHYTQTKIGAMLDRRRRRRPNIAPIWSPITRAYIMDTSGLNKGK